MKKIFLFVIFFLEVLMLTSCDCDFADQREEMCNRTPCTDSLCMHWNKSIKRCGTSAALLKEQDRQGVISLELFKRLIEDKLDSQYRYARGLEKKRNGEIDALLIVLENNYKGSKKITTQIREHLKDTSDYVKINKHRNDLLKDLEKDEKTYNIFNSSEKIMGKRE